MRSTQLNPVDLYDRVTKNGKYISKEQFKDFIENELSLCNLTQRQIYIIKKLYKGYTITSLMYDFGYKSTSTASREVKTAVSKIRAYFNYKYATAGDPITYIVNDRILEQSFDIEKTDSICEVMTIFESKGVHGRINEIIFYSILRKFEFDSCSILKLENKSKIPAIQLYLALYENRSEPKFLFPEYQHLFVKNLQNALRRLGEIFPEEFIPTSIAVACQYLKSDKFYELLAGKLFERLIENPEVVLFSEEYFNHMDLADCTLDYLINFYPFTYYDEDSIDYRIGDWTIKGFIDWALAVDSGDKRSFNEFYEYEEFMKRLEEINPTIKKYHTDLLLKKYDELVESGEIIES